MKSKQASWLRKNKKSTYETQWKENFWRMYNGDVFIISVVKINLLWASDDYQASKLAGTKQNPEHYQKLSSKESWH